MILTKGICSYCEMVCEDEFCDNDECENLFWDMISDNDDIDYMEALKDD